MLKRSSVGAVLCVLSLAACGRTELEFSGAGQSGGVGVPAGRDAGVDVALDRGSGGVDGRGGRVGATGGASGVGGSGGSRGTGGIPGSGGRPGTGGRASTGGAPGVDGGIVRDAGADRTPDAGSLPPSTPGVFVCGAQTCSTTTQSCCVSIAIGSVGARCIPAGTTCTGAALGCDEPADCAAGVCCFGLQAGAGGTVSIGSSCVARATCNGIGRFVVCRANGDCRGATPICCTGLAVPICQATCPGG